MYSNHLLLFLLYSYFYVYSYLLTNHSIAICRTHSVSNMYNYTSLGYRKHSFKQFLIILDIMIITKLITIKLIINLSDNNI